MVVLGILWVPFIRTLSSQMFVYLQSVSAYISPPIAVVFLFGVAWPRANYAGAVAALASGAVLGTARFVFEVMKARPIVTDSPALTWFVSVNFLHFAVLLFVIATALLVGVSLATPPAPAGQLRGLTFRTLEGGYASTDADRGVMRWQAVLSAALMLSVIALWVIFR